VTRDRSWISVEANSNSIEIGNRDIPSRQKMHAPAISDEMRANESNRKLFVPDIISVAFTCFWNLTQSGPKNPIQFIVIHTLKIYREHWKSASSSAT
jgi:hypothetical protein